MSLSLYEKAFRDWLHNAETVVLMCRDLGHIWGNDSYNHAERLRHGAYLLTMECDRGCKVERKRYLTSSGSLDPSQNTYKYPPNYLVPTEMYHESFFMDADHRAMVRKEIIRRRMTEND